MTGTRDHRCHSWLRPVVCGEVCGLGQCTWWERCLPSGYDLWSVARSVTWGSVPGWSGACQVAATCGLWRGLWPGAVCLVGAGLTRWM